MPDTAEKWLSELNSLYTPLPSHFDAAKGHKDSIETRLDYVLGVYRMFEIGSLRHGTGIWHHSDGDYLASLKGIRPTSSGTMLTKVRDALVVRFPSTVISVRSPAVVCHFSDCKVEVVPGYIFDTGDDHGYWIADPASPGAWMKTYPEAHNRYVNDVSRRVGAGSVKKLARQLKVWKYERNVPVSSCYLEMRAARHMSGEDRYVPLWDLYLTLKQIRDAGLAAMNDPTGLGSRFTACSSEANRLNAMSKLDSAVNRALKAKDYAHEGYQMLAIEQLKLLFDQ